MWYLQFHFDMYNYDCYSSQMLLFYSGFRSYFAGHEGFLGGFPAFIGFSSSKVDFLPKRTVCQCSLQAVFLCMSIALEYWQPLLICVVVFCAALVSHALWTVRDQEAYGRSFIFQISPYHDRPLWDCAIMLLLFVFKWAPFFVALPAAAFLKGIFVLSLKLYCPMHSRGSIEKHRDF